MSVNVKMSLKNALQVCQISTRYRYKQIMYDERKRTNLFKLYQELG